MGLRRDADLLTDWHRDGGPKQARPGPARDDPDESVFTIQPKQSDDFFPAAVRRAQAALRAASRDPSWLEGYVWHSNRHSLASRLVMAGVDLHTVQELGGWRTFVMVARYAHLAPGHLRAAVERLVVPGGCGGTVPKLSRDTHRPAFRRRSAAKREVPAKSAS
jgi:integrase